MKEIDINKHRQMLYFFDSRTLSVVRNTTSPKVYISCKTQSSLEALKYWGGDMAHNCIIVRHVMKKKYKALWEMITGCRWD